MKYFIFSLFSFSALMLYAAPPPSKSAQELAQWLNEHYEVTAASTAAYRYSFPKNDPRRLKLDDVKNKIPIQQNIEKKLAKELDSQFTQPEIIYLKQLFGHKLMERFDVFRKKLVSPYAINALEQTLEVKPTMSKQNTSAAPVNR